MQLFNIGYSKMPINMGFTILPRFIQKHSFCNDYGYSVKTLQGFGGLKAEFGFVF